jgi:hypothetical protein
MLTMQQNLERFRPLECVWTSSDKGLVCAWVERQMAASQARERNTGRAGNIDRRVA